MGSAFDDEVASGERFEFGKNWARFLEVLDDERVANAQESLAALLGTDDLTGKRFLDIGSGSGLFSLAARQMGAEVHSFDYDPQSVGCTEEVRRRFRPNDAGWIVEQGSALDEEYLQGLGEFDVVYSWGVLHHTGAMWRALENAATPVKRDGGLLVVAIYNDQEERSVRWLRVKKLYCSGSAGRALVTGYFVPKFFLRGLLSDLKHGRNPTARYTAARERGMSVVRDWFDWLGGLPFEVASPEAVFRFYRDRGFELVEMTTVGGALGCNEFVFRRK